MTKSIESRIILGVILIGLVLVVYGVLHEVYTICQLYRVGLVGNIVEADILERKQGTGKFHIMYSVNDRQHNTWVRVSNPVYSQYYAQNKFPIKVLEDEPSIVTWDGDRRLHVGAFNIILAVFVGTLMMIALVTQCIYLRKR